MNHLFLKCNSISKPTAKIIFWKYLIWEKANKKYFFKLNKKKIKNLQFSKNKLLLHKNNQVTKQIKKKKQDFTTLLKEIIEVVRVISIVICMRLIKTKIRIWKKRNN